MSYYQHSLAPANGDRKLALLNSLANQFLNEATFDQLRTKEQLGYVVWVSTRDARDIISSWFLIQSSVKGCEHIRTRLDIHMDKMRKKIDKMTDEEFDTIKSAVNTRISEKDKNQQENFERIWIKELSTHKYVFDRQDKNIALLATVTKQEFVDFFMQMYF